MPDSIDVPAWVQDAIFYEIFPDRFAQSSRVKKPSNLEPWLSPPTRQGYKGGDLLGVVEKLDYLQDLGITALYFTPIFQSASNHRYHTHNYFQVDPMLGGNAALRELLDEAHRRDMKVVLDGVFNHASRGFFQFNDILENDGYSAYLDWFRVHQFPLNAYGPNHGYEAWWNLPALPKFNTKTPAVREFLWEVATHWLEFGIDGWRLDVPNEIDDDSFWQEFRRRCKSINPECYLVGEIWGDARRWLQGDQFDAVMNYPLTKAILGFVANRLNEKQIKQSGYHSITNLDAPRFSKLLETFLHIYPTPITNSLLNLLGSHDTPRALTLLCDDEAALRQAFLLQLTLPGAPCIYYGDELGLTGNHDPDNRQAMPWGETWNTELRDDVKKLIGLRKTHAALRHGNYKTLYAHDGVLVFLREAEGSCAVAINISKKAVQLEVTLENIPSGIRADELSGLTVQVGEKLQATLPARSSLLVKL